MINTSEKVPRNMGAKMKAPNMSQKNYFRLQITALFEGELDKKKHSVVRKRGWKRPHQPACRAGNNSEVKDVQRYVIRTPSPISVEPQRSINNGRTEGNGKRKSFH